MELSYEDIQIRRNLERAYLDNSLTLDTLKEYINNMIPNIKIKNELLSLNELIQLFILDNNYFQKLSRSLVLKLLDDEVKERLTSRTLSLKKSKEESFTLMKDLLDKCDKLKRLDFNATYLIK